MTSPYDGIMKVGTVAISRRRYSYLRSLGLSDALIEGITKFIPPEDENMESPVNFQHARQLKARARVMDYYTKQGWTHADGSPVTLEHIFVISFSFVMGNWRTIIMTAARDDRYFEVTHNGLANETYLEVYEQIDSERYIDIED